MIPTDLYFTNFQNNLGHKYSINFKINIYNQQPVFSHYNSMGYVAH